MLPLPSWLIVTTSDRASADGRCEVSGEGSACVALESTGFAPPSAPGCLSMRVVPIAHTIPATATTPTTANIGNQPCNEYGPAT